MHGLAFFPWAPISESLEVGPVRLIPYERGELPGDLEHITQQDIDSILAAYALRPGKLIRRATLLEHGEWKAGMDPTHVVANLFRARELIAMSALSARRFFRGHSDYCGADQYALIVQRYKPGDTEDFSFSTRRRDGHAQRLWGSDEFAFQCPLHVDPHDFRLDEPLLVGLLKKPLPDGVRESIVEFLGANTDSSAIPEHSEVVMTKCAFEFLFGIGHTDRELEDALEAAFESVDASAANGPLEGAWSKRLKKAKRLIGAWAREFNVIRGTSAHGAPRGKAKTVWSAHAHLAFTAILFPLVLKQKLQALGSYALTPRDVAMLRRVEEFLMHDPFDAAHFRLGADHPWPEIESRAMWEVHKADMAALIRKATTK